MTTVYVPVGYSRQRSQTEGTRAQKPVCSALVLEVLGQPLADGGGLQHTSLLDVDGIGGIRAAQVEVVRGRRDHDCDERVGERLSDPRGVPGIEQPVGEDDVRGSLDGGEAAPVRLRPARIELYAKLLLALMLVRLAMGLRWAC